MFIQVCRYPHEDVHAALFRKGKKGKQKGKRKKKKWMLHKGVTWRKAHHRVDSEQQRKRDGAVSALCRDAVRGPGHAAGEKASR